MFEKASSSVVAGWSAQRLLDQEVLLSFDRVLLLVISLFRRRMILSVWINTGLSVYVTGFSMKSEVLGFIANNCVIVASFILRCLCFGR